MPNDRIKRPSYPWYPGDFKRDTGVQSCPFTVRSIWREMLDLMHDGEPYGHLTAGGQPITAEELARMLGLPVRAVRQAFEELGRKLVYGQTDVGVIYSRRMVKDEATRIARATGGSRSLDNPNVPRPKAGKDTPEDTQEDSHKDGGNDTVPLACARACPAADANADASTEEIPSPIDLMARWNTAATRLPKCLKLTPDRERHARARLKEEPDLAVWQADFERMDLSDFAAGQNDRGWKADFDWAIKVGTVTKLREGKYDNRPGTVPQRELEEARRYRFNVYRGKCPHDPPCAAGHGDDCLREIAAYLRSERATA